MTHAPSYPRYGVTVDCVVFGFDPAQDTLQLLLIERAIPPFKGEWALPGGFALAGESTEDAALRELFEETGLQDIFLEQLYTFSSPARDPRGRVISVAYMALVQPAAHHAIASTDAARAMWHSTGALPELAFDHAQIVEVAQARLRGKLRYQPVGFELLPDRFTLSQLQHLYEVIIQSPQDKRNFQRKIRKTGLLIDTGQTQTNVSHRAAKFYRFDWDRYAQLERDGFEFAL